MTSLLKDHVRSKSEMISQNFCVDSPVEDIWSQIKIISAEVLDKLVPSKITSSHFTQPWVTRKIRSLIRKKSATTTVLVAATVRMTGNYSKIFASKSNASVARQTLRISPDTYLTSPLGINSSTDTFGPNGPKIVEFLHLSTRVLPL